MIRIVLMLALAICATIRPAYAQAPTGTLNVTVVDQTGAVIPGATVTIVGIDDATKAATLPPVQTSGQGVAIVPRLVPGRYSIKAEFPGFQPKDAPDVRVRAGDNRQVLLLSVEVRESVTVEQNRQEAAADPRGPSFGTTLTREQLEALSDDPDELRRQLQDMAGPGAVIRVDSFEGAALPPKAQIRSIRISRDQFAAENHSAGGISVEIITQPGIGPVRYNTGFRFRGGSLSGRSPFTPTKGPEQLSNYNVNMNGTLIPEKASFGLFMGGQSSYETPNINVALGTGTRSEALRLRTPRDNVNVNANVDYALTLDQTLRFGYNAFRVKNGNLGIGAFDEEERAFSNENMSQTIRGQHMGPLGRRMFTRTRLQFSWSDSESVSSIEQPTIRVIDAFTRGGAQVAGGQHTRTLTFGSDLDYVRGIHTLRTGIAFDGSRYRSNDTSNYLGTYTFESLQAFEEGRPRSYTRRIGDPNIRYSNLQGSLYVQDDARVRRNLTLSAGVRYEAQTHVRDFDTILPRVGITFAPFASGVTTLRASWGIFSDWLQNNAYEQTLRVDGFRQQELDIRNPTYPDITTTGIVVPVNRYLLSDSLELPRTNRLSLGLDQRFLRVLQVNLTYSYQRGGALLRGLNRNTPVDGVRPDPFFGNVIEVVSDASSRQHQIQTNLTVNPGALLPAFNAPRIGFKRVTLFVNHTYTDFTNNADGPFSTPATGSLANEWGPAGGDVRHRFNATLNNQIIRNLLVSLNMNVNTGAPYTIRTGLDGNGDLIFNDRPDGVGRNTLRMDGQWNLNTAFAYTIGFGRTQTGLPPGVTVISGNVTTFNQAAPRFRVQLFLQVQNATNHANYQGYSGVLTSPFFGKPTTVANTRKVDLGLNLSF